ncbi:related to 2-polyprenyl-6-methoxyphenol hydroxylase and related FAD-dependent oxidoreductases [Cephalotrichum gorgonifer]|uniref:Related to 2-polyprenyl-6-methoxyphenol hydroxylase and related FAD-dependent oxidoreductases n=1 Tax=Cephalotrichum gorgonifer TaxID=2041049 RepID=A0AAE8N6A1_9PEZI|nr:related to 2-polyprenyl-6-methoxyphenol hydroxylase and related FAD-dependent oxidoreductases [Cephalotrichum gorgonifer]
MAPLRVLVCGGGCAGPALGFWLTHAGHHVTIVERFPILRASGAQIDLRAQGIQVIKRMGLLDALRRNLVDEAGMAYGDDKGNVIGTMMANKSGKGAQGFTSEFEIMRGDFVRMLYEETKDRVKYVFGKTVERYEQDDKRVVAYFSDGSSGEFDLLVGADGQGSRIRKAMLPADAPDPYRRLGIHAAIFFIPRGITDNNICRMFYTTGGRMIMRRTHSETESCVILFVRDDSSQMRNLPKSPIEQQKEVWHERFRDLGPETEVPRFLEGMKTSGDFYTQEAVQVRTDTWHKGRVVLLGDAAACPSPFSGLGTTSAMVGAYVLAGEISRSPDDLPKAFRTYDEVLRPFTVETQNINPSLLRLAMPESRIGVSILHSIARVAFGLGIPKLIERFSSEEKGGWKLPDYPELPRLGEESS